LCVENGKKVYADKPCPSAIKRHEQPLDSSPVFKIRKNTGATEVSVPADVATPGLPVDDGTPAGKLKVVNAAIAHSNELGATCKKALDDGGRTPACKQLMTYLTESGVLVGALDGLNQAVAAKPGAISMAQLREVQRGFQKIVFYKNIASEYVATYGDE
jgi:hypothetical protein